MVDLNDLPLCRLFDELTRDGVVKRLVQLAHEEDLGPDRCDITSASIIDESSTGKGVFVCREAGVIAGLASAPMVCARFAPHCLLHTLLSDGESVQAGATIASLIGPLREILAAERTALNMLCRLSGIATLTARYVEAVSEAAQPAPKVCDTRKTTPGLRALEKYAVRCGGGWLHRAGLYDAMLIKDNHMRTLGTPIHWNRLARAIERARSMTDLRFVEIEVDTLDQLAEALRLAPGLIDMALLDNMPVCELSEAVSMRDELAPSVALEASGGVTLESIADIARTGVDRISVGALTHSAPALDIGFDLA